MKKFIKNCTGIVLILLWTGMCTTAEASAKSPHKQVSYRSDCIIPQATYNLEITNVRVRLKNGPYFHSLSMTGQNYPQGINPEPYSPFNGTSLWMGGMDAFNNLKVAANTYNAPSSNDFWAGPVNPETSSTSLGDCNQWDKFFSVKGQNVEIHKTRFLQAESAGIEYRIEDIPIDVLGWPGINNPHFESVHGFAIPTYISHLAPFYDLDNDGVYNPQSGDYPYNGSRDFTISEDLQAKQEMVFSISNDIGNIHTASRGTPMGAEIRTLAFAFETEGELGNMMFFNTKIINTGPGLLKQFYAGIWSDPQPYCAIGNKYLGFDPTRNMAYVYEFMEESECECFMLGNDCSLIPVTGLRMYRGLRTGPDFNSSGVSSFMYYLNGSIGNAPPGMSDPSSALEYYHYLSGKWRDGTPLTYGGSGYDPQSTAYTNFAYPSNPSSTDPNSWSMCNTSSIIGDRRMVMATGPASLLPGEINDFTFGTVAALMPNNGCPDITILQENSDVAVELFGLETVSSNLFAELENGNARLFPNPYFRSAHGNNICLHFRDLPSSCELSIIDMKGKTLAFSNLQNIGPDQFTWEPGAAQIVPGLYFIRVAQNNRTHQILKLLIME